jgi:hypothetical protein
MGMKEPRPAVPRHRECAQWFSLAIFQKFQRDCLKRGTSSAPSADSVRIRSRDGAKKSRFAFVGIPAWMHPRLFRQSLVSGPISQPAYQGFTPFRASSLANASALGFSAELWLINTTGLF